MLDSELIIRLTITSKSSSKVKKIDTRVRKLFEMFQNNTSFDEKIIFVCYIIKNTSVNFIFCHLIIDFKKLGQLSL